MSKYALKISCKEAVSCFDGIMTEEGTEVWIEDSEWGPTSGHSMGEEGSIPYKVKKFNTPVAAANFARKWKGHPWYYVPNGKFKIFELTAHYTKFSHYTGKEVDETA